MIRRPRLVSESSPVSVLALIIHLLAEANAGVSVPFRKHAGRKVAIR